MPATTRRTPTSSRTGGGPAGRAGRPPKSHVASPAEQHAEWLGLLGPDGPFLTVPVLAEVLPHGLDTVPDGTRDRIRRGWAEVSEAPDLLTPAWVELILGELLRFPVSAREEQTGPGPDLILYGPQPGGGRAARMHVYRQPADTPLTQGRGDRVALTEQAAQRCRETGVPLALLTNGQHWALVHARHSGETAGVGVFDADLWLEEPVLLRAFATLLAAPRVLLPPTHPDGTPTTSLAALFARSAEALTQITTTLGDQVRQAVELFVGELARLDRESGGALLEDVDDREVYKGALTVLMRLVFLLYAEDQRLLPIGDPLYQQAYAASTLHGQLGAVGDEEVSDRRAAAWPRLLALFAAVHGGCEHPDLRIPAHGGSLFNPERFTWLVDAAVTDRVVHAMLDALLVLRHRGKAAERLSYSSLGVEQIGHVYEGLLDFSCLRVREPYVGLIGKREPELPLTELESAAQRGEEALRSWLATRCDLTPKQLEKARAAAPGSHDLAALHAACDNDASLADRVRPYWGLLRRDLRGLPTVFPAHSVLFTQDGDRRATGTHYTPRELAEEVVRHTLAPLCYAPGPAEGIVDEGVWRAKTPDELLKLKVLDPAMGSGAFLVAACRYLAEVLVRAWERHGLPADVAELAENGRNTDDLLLAARRLVAARCLYGVDRDDMAVELAKLSLWIVTLAKGRPFGFLDHALRHGDSLVGITSMDQLTAFHLDPKEGRALHSVFHSVIDPLHERVGEITRLREQIESSVVQDARDAAEKEAKLRQADALGENLRLAADAVVAAALSTAVRRQDVEEKLQRYDDRLVSIRDKVYALLTDSMGSDGAAGSKLEAKVRATLGDWLRGERKAPIRPLHWPLEFPEVINRGGFDAVIANPPFVGGKKVSGAIGTDLREYIKQRIANDKPGNADLCSYFLLRKLSVARRGRVGIIATNTIAQGDTREVGLDQAVDMGWTVYRANKSQPWPGTASLEVSLLWVGHAGADETPVLDGRPVRGITPSLDAQSRVTGKPYRLAANANQAFIGSLVLGMGFILDPADAQALITKDPRNRKILFPYLNGEDLNSRPDCTARRWAINFHDWPEDEAKRYTDCYTIIEREVKPQRLQANQRDYRDLWWRYARIGLARTIAIKDLKKVLVIALVSRTGLPVFAPNNQVFSHKLGVIATDRSSHLTLLSSSFHTLWAWKYSSTMKADLNYSPSDVYETFPQADPTKRMERVGAELDEYRRSVMRGRELGLTKLYNLVHDEQVISADIRRLRDIHVEIDEAVAEAYGWSDLSLGHGFHETRQGVRFTIDPTVQVEVLDNLLELNHQRHEQEKQPNSSSKRKPGKRPAAAPRPLASTEEPALMQPTIDGLFSPPDALF